MRKYLDYITIPQNNLLNRFTIIFINSILNLFSISI